MHTFTFLNETEKNCRVAYALFSLQVPPKSVVGIFKPNPCPIQKWERHQHDSYVKHILPPKKTLNSWLLKFYENLMGNKERPVEEPIMWLSKQTKISHIKRIVYSDHILLSFGCQMCDWRTRTNCDLHEVKPRNHYSQEQPKGRKEDIYEKHRSLTHSYTTLTHRKVYTSLIGTWFDSCTKRLVVFFG